MHVMVVAFVPFVARWGRPLSLHPTQGSSIWVKWQSSGNQERPDPNTVVNALGLCFGQHLVDRLGFRWAVSTDEQGTEMGCIAQPGDITVFPANATAKRLEKEAKPFFAELFSEVDTRVRALRRQQPN